MPPCLEFNANIWTTTGNGPKSDRERTTVERDRTRQYKGERKECEGNNQKRTQAKQIKKKS